MCGLACVARIDGAHLEPEADALLARMARTLAHRGPDEEELLRAGPVGLAFNRLSLVDPAGGGQPLTTADGSIVLIANGEVYNHKELSGTLRAGTRLRTRSDCEVLVHLYEQEGLNFLDRVAGMFGLILWDRRRGRLILARDRFGIKPLYFHRNAERIVVSSEMKALFADPATPRRLNWDAALAHPLFSAVPVLTDTPPTTWFDDIQCVPAGCIVEIDLRDGRTREHRYWRFPGPGREIPASDEAVVSEFRELLGAAVRDTATADAEIGLFLSGGVDSAAVAAFAAPVRHLQTFTVLNGSTYLNGDAQFGHLVARHLGHDNHQVVFDTDRVPGVDEWKRLLWLLESPECGPEQFFKHELHRYARMIRPDLKGMLLGAASDEFNGGYSSEYVPSGDWAAFTSTLGDMARRGAVWKRPQLATWLDHFGSSVLSDDFLARSTARSTEAPHTDPYRAYLDWEYRKIQQYNCWHEDRTAAGSGIEARVPFLDHRLVELVAAIPPERRPRLLWDKRIVREAVRDLLPAEVVQRAKGAFFYGDGLRYTFGALVRMLAQDGGALLEEALAAPGSHDHLNADGARRTLRALADDQASDRVVLFLRLVNLGLLDQMTHELPAALVDRPAGAPPRALDIDDWSQARPAIERLVLDRPALHADLVPRFADGVLLLDSPAEPGTSYVTVDGSIEYVIDDENPPWRAFVHMVDGVRSLGEAAAAAAVPIDTIEPDLQFAVEHGVMVVEPRPLGSDPTLLHDAIPELSTELTGSPVKVGASHGQPR
jgi:asparagine synthase (glutamine-hydrolysing)